MAYLKTANTCIPLGQELVFVVFVGVKQLFLFFFKKQNLKSILFRLTYIFTIP